MTPRVYFVYLLSNERRTVLYTGVTSNLAQRIAQHRTGSTGAFTTRYRTTDLMWFEAHPDVADAIAREKTLKRWQRAWKWDLVRTVNPDLRDLSPELIHVR